jgi:DNA repair protein RadC
MSYKVPLKVTEVQLTYKNKIKPNERPQISGSNDAYRVLESNWSDQIELVEEFNMLLLDRSNRVLGMYPVSKGGLNGTVVHLKIIFAAALKGRASAIIAAHNHPSGPLKPSQSDIDVTRKLVKAGEILEIKVMDHLILSPHGEYFSFADEIGMGL